MSLASKFAFMTDVVRCGVGVAVDVNSVIKVATAYGDRTFATSTTAASEAHTAFAEAVQAVTAAARSGRTGGMLDHTLNSGTPPEACPNNVIRSGAKRYKTSSHPSLYALWILNHPGWRLQEAFYNELADVHDGLTDMEATCSIAVRALSSDMMSKTVSDLVAAFELLGVTVHG